MNLDNFYFVQFNKRWNEHRNTAIYYSQLSLEKTLQTFLWCDGLNGIIHSENLVPYKKVIQKHFKKSLGNPFEKII